MSTVIYFFITPIILLNFSNINAIYLKRINYHDLLIHMVIFIVSYFFIKCFVSPFVLMYLTSLTLQSIENTFGKTM